MRIEDFKDKFENDKHSEKSIYSIMCYSAIGISIFLSYTVFIDPHSKGLLFLAVFLFFLGVYGIFALRNHYQLTYLENKNTESENLDIVLSVIEGIAKGGVTRDENSFHFIYQKSCWRLAYDVYIFACPNLIVVNAEGKDSYDGGFIDFGASKRAQKKITNLLKEKAIC